MAGLLRFVKLCFEIPRNSDPNGVQYKYRGQSRPPQRAVLK